MFRNSYRGTLIWMLIVGVALVLTMLAGEVPAAFAAALLAAYMGLAFLVVRNVQLGSVTVPWSGRGKREKEPTEVAREATARARSSPNYDALIRLLDVGLIVDEQRPDGMSLRRGRFISLDDDGIRPFAIVSVPEALSARLGHIRFEIRDEAGRLHYAFEEEEWFQAGENILLPDYRFAIRKKAAELEPGAWTAHVLVDGGVLGIHHFNVSPSLVARRLQMGTDGEIMRERVWRTEVDDESLPLSLEELLRQQSREQRKN